MTTRYLVTVPNEQFSETSCGIPFNRGRAVVDEMTLDPGLGKTVEEVIAEMKQLGYKIQPIIEEKKPSSNK